MSEITVKNKTDLSIIHEAVCEFFYINKIDIFELSRKKDLIIKRQFFHYLCRELNPEYIVTFNDIGKYYSDVTGHKYKHCTVINSHNKIKGYVETYPNFRRMNEDLIKLIDKKTKKYFVSEDDSALNILMNCEKIATT